MKSKDIKKNNRFSIRKLTIGAASVLIGVTFMGVAGSQTQVQAADAGAKTETTSDSNSSAEGQQSDQTQTVKNDVDVQVKVDNDNKEVTANVNYGEKHFSVNAPEVKTDPKVTTDGKKNPADSSVTDNITYAFKDTTDNSSPEMLEKTKIHDVTVQGQTNYYKFVQDVQKNSDNDRWAYLDSKTGELKFVEVIQDEKDGKWVLPNNQVTDAPAPSQATKYNIGLIVTPNKDEKNSQPVTATIIIDDSNAGNDIVSNETHTVNQTIIINYPDGLTNTDARHIVLTLENGKWISQDGTVFNEYPIPQIPGYDSYYKIGENGQLIKSTTVPAYSALTADGQPAADQVVYISYQKIETPDENNGTDNNGKKDVEKTTKKTVNKGNHRKAQMPTTTRVATYHAEKAVQKQATLPQAGESTSQAGIIGMVIAVAGSILGLAGFKKRKN